eukprot:m51a1_g9488 hypothetical protein (355) ;mRNA; r:634509-636311
MSRIPAELLEKWQFICTKSYADQAKWMLNGFWDKLEPEAENLWGWVQSFIKFDESKRAAGCDLDEFWSHKFLESLGETMTVIEMRERFRAIDADFNKRMSLVEYTMFRYKFAIPDVINAPQGENKEEIAKAQAMVDAAQRAVEDMNAKLELSRAAAQRAKEAVVEANKKAAVARSAADESKKAAEAAWFAEQEQKKALDELHAQEKAYNDRKEELERLKNDSTAGVVKRNKAANELDQLLAEDPLPLRKAKINQAAAVKKSEKAREAAEAAKALAERNAAEAQAAAEASEEAARDAERAAQAVEAAVAEAEAKLQEALDYLEKAKRLGGIANGDIWWMQREIIEKKKYLPAKRQ